MPAFKKNLSPSNHSSKFKKYSKKFSMLFLKTIEIVKKKLWVYKKHKKILIFSK